MRISRRTFLGAVGAGALGSALGACGSVPGAPPRAVRSRYRSRPDLRPPIVEVRRSGGPLSPGYTLVTPAGPLVVDDDGEPTWVHPVDLATTNLQVQRYRGRPVLTWWEGHVVHGHGKGRGVLVDDAYREVGEVRGGNGLDADLHELRLTDRGTAYITAYAEGHADLRPIGGPERAATLDAVVQEIDLASGSVVFQWRSSDHISLSETYATYAFGEAYDPVHVNSIEPLADGSLLLSARNTWALYKVDRRTGAIVWRLGGRQSDFAVEEAARFAWQHDARGLGSGQISLFDDEASPAQARQSRGLILDVDEARREVHLGEQFVHGPDALLAGSQGSVQALPDGQVLVGWGARPYYTQYDRDGTILLDAHLLEGISYRARRDEWTGQPSGRPAMVLERTGPRARTVYVSWNGATEVRAWQVIAGESPGTLGPVVTAPRRGFETVIPVATELPYLAVRALDRCANVLGVSAVAKAAPAGKPRPPP